MAPTSASRPAARAFTVALAVALLAVIGVWRPSPLASAGTAAQEVVTVRNPYFALRTPPFLEVGKRYAFTWPGGGPPQTYTIRSIRPDGWVQVIVAEDNTDPAFVVPGELPTMWLHAGLALSIMQMRPLP